MLYNQTKKKKITSNVVLCKNIFSHGSGLMFRSRKSVKDKAWVFAFHRPRQVSLTMFFVFFPIDVLFLDDSKKIVELKKNLRPFGFYTPKHKVKYVVELKEETVKNKKIKLNDVLKF